MGRDIAHAKLKNGWTEGEKVLPQYIRSSIYYAGPAKTPEGTPPGRLGRLPQDEWTLMLIGSVAEALGMIMLAKGNRSQQVTDACKHGGFCGQYRQPRQLVLARGGIQRTGAWNILSGMEGYLESEVEDFRPLFWWMIKVTISSSRFSHRSARAALVCRRPAGAVKHDSAICRRTAQAPYPVYANRCYR